MTLDELVSEMCEKCIFAEWYIDEDGLGRDISYIEGCRRDCTPFWNEEEEAADCEGWKRRREDD